jgi:zinc and cadmium transporter
MAGALLALVAIERLPGLLPYLLTFASSSFLYIAMADLIPDLHRGQIDARAFRQLLLVGAGVLTVVGL